MRPSCATQISLTVRKTYRWKPAYPRWPISARDGGPRRWSPFVSSTGRPPLHRRRPTAVPLRSYFVRQRKVAHLGVRGHARLAGQERWASRLLAMSRSSAHGAAESVAATKLRGSWKGRAHRGPDMVSASFAEGSEAERRGRTHGKVLGIVVSRKDEPLGCLAVPCGDDVTEPLLSLICPPQPMHHPHHHAHTHIHRIGSDVILLLHEQGRVRKRKDTVWGVVLELVDLDVPLLRHPPVRLQVHDQPESGAYGWRRGWRWPGVGGKRTGLK